MDVGIEQTFSPKNFSMWMTFGLRTAKMLG